MLCFVLRWAGLLCPADARLTSADSQDDDLDDLDPDVSFAWHVPKDVWQQRLVKGLWALFWATGTRPAALARLCLHLAQASASEYHDEQSLPVRPYPLLVQHHAMPLICLRCLLCLLLPAGPVCGHVSFRTSVNVIAGILERWRPQRCVVPLTLCIVCCCCIVPLDAPHSLLCL